MVLRIKSAFSKEKVWQSKLEEIIHTRLAKNAELVEKALAFSPKDFKAPAELVSFSASSCPSGQGDVMMKLGDLDPMRLHPHAIGHVAGISGVHNGFIASMLSKQEPWATELVSYALNETWRHLRVDKTGRPPAHLVRTDPWATATVKAVLSASYKTIDVRPMLSEFLLACDSHGLVPYRANSGDLTFAIKLIRPNVFMVSGDAYALGLELRNTDWGGTAASIGVFFERLVCLNGMTTEKILRQTHLGARLDRDIDWSDKTLELNRRASLEAMRDVISSFFSEGRFESMVDQVRVAGSVTASSSQIASFLGSKVTKDVSRRVVEMFDSADTVRIPAGPSWLRAAQALSAVSQDVEKNGGGVDSVLELERIAGQLMSHGAELSKTA